MGRSFLTRKFLIGTILLLFVILFSFLITDGYFTLNRDIKISSAGSLDIINQRLSSLLSEVNIFPQFVGNDLIFLSRLSSFKKVMSSEESNEDVISDLENDFLEFLKGSASYYQLGYINNEGNEVAKVEFDGKTHKITPKENLENRKDEVYFAETLNFNEGEVFISQISLNMKNGEIENRGTIEDPEYVPIILAAVPTFNENRENTGVIFLSFYADYFLDDIRNFQREGEKVFLVNEEGYYFAHPNREKEFAFTFGKVDNIYNDYPEISEEVLFDYNKRRFETDDLIFSFRYLYPTAGDFGIHKGSKKIFGENPEERYFWVLVSVSDKDEINKTINELKREYFYFLLFSGIITLIIVLLIFIAVFKGFDKNSFGRKIGG